MSCPMVRSRLAIVILLAAALGARAEGRVALVIGNGAYQEATSLANPVNDATDVAARLRGLGFTVIEGHDLEKRALERRIGEFADALAGADAGLFYYAGHGVQVDGRNYILPVDARLDGAVKLQLESVPIDQVLDIMEHQAKTSLVFLDACRNNPFARSGAKGGDRAARALSGLAPFDAARGSFIAFSTAPGAVALDGSGRNSPFAAALITHIGRPGQSINDLMIAVRRDVVAATGGQQRPWEQGSLVERFEFVPGGAAQPTTDKKPPAVEVAAAERSVGDAGAIEDFVRNRYLAPDANDIAGMVERLYVAAPTIFGTQVERGAAAAAKAGWFAQFASWTLELETGSLDVAPRGEGRAEASFLIRYDYRPKAAGTAAVAGRARVMLGLVRAEDGWRIESETTAAAP
ncbi:MAG TPA: peptidase C14 [Rhizobiales bacterium]|nr:peptidase C14 [Hyphomicrobiales bacterium]